MKLITTLFFLFCLTIAFSQSSYKINYANKLYSELNYKECATVFEEIALKQKNNKEEYNKYALLSAESYYFSRNFSAAFKMFKSVDSSSFSEDQLFQYFDVLLRLENYTEINVLNRFIQTKYHVSSEELIQNINELKNKADFKIKEFNLNGQAGDYSLCIIDSVIWFSSNRSDIGFTHDEYPWDGRNYSNLYTVQNNLPVLSKDKSSRFHDGPIEQDNNGNLYVTRTSLNKKGDKHVEVKIYNGSVVNDFWLNSQEYNVGHVCFNADFSKMFFASDIPGGTGGTDIYFCTKQADGSWSNPRNMIEVNTKDDELFPFVSSENVLYFSSNGFIGLGGLDIYKYNDEVINLGAPINSKNDDFGLIFDGMKNGYFSSDRLSNIDKIFSFDLLIFNGVLDLVALDFKTKLPIGGVNVQLVERGTNDTLNIKTNAEGKISAKIISGKDYIIVGDKKDYELKSPIYLSTENLRANETISKELFFDHKKYDIKVKTIDKSTGEIVGLVNGNFIDNETGTSIPYNTDEYGITYVNLDNYHNYMALASKKGYLDLQVDVMTSSELLIELDLRMEEIKKDMTFKIENIFYDLDKSNLRDSSKSELDKLVKFLSVNNNISIELSSHTDSRGSDQYNLILSQKRAQSCVNYLIQNGIPPGQIIAKGYGETKLVNSCGNKVNCSEEQHQENRRTEIKILKVE